LRGRTGAPTMRINLAPPLIPGQRDFRDTILPQNLASAPLRPQVTNPSGLSSEPTKNPRGIPAAGAKRASLPHVAPIPGGYRILAARSLLPRAGGSISPAAISRKPKPPIAAYWTMDGG
jgi:hypothetical protein